VSKAASPCDPDIRAMLLQSKKYPVLVNAPTSLSLRAIQTLDVSCHGRHPTDAMQTDLPADANSENPFPWSRRPGRRSCPACVAHLPYTCNVPLSKSIACKQQPSRPNTLRRFHSLHSSMPTNNRGKGASPERICCEAARGGPGGSQPDRPDTQQRKSFATQM
jgi:hypothetical protein